MGHLHCNLKAPDADVGGGPAYVHAEWHGEEAQKLASVLRSSETGYPHTHRYLPWPGPNSNTFAAWVLRTAGIDLELPWRAIGKDFA